MTTAAPAPPSTLREYEVRASSTPTFGRVLCSARDHHFVVDGPVQNGCPGEAITPVEVFLSAVAACGVELIHVIARDEGVPLERVGVTITGTVDRARQNSSRSSGMRRSNSSGKRKVRWLTRSAFRQRARSS